MSHFSVYLRKLDKNDITESLLSIVCDTNGAHVGSIIVDAVLVVLGVTLGCENVVRTMDSKCQYMYSVKKTLKSRFWMPILPRGVPFEGWYVRL